MINETKITETGVYLIEEVITYYIVIYFVLK